MRPAFRIDHVAIQTGNLEESIRFYEEVLGFQPIKTTFYKGRHGRWFQGPNIKVEIFTGKPDQTLTPWTDLITGPMHICIAVSEFDAAVQYLRAKDVSFYKEPFQPEPGQWVAIIRGPDNEEIELRQG